STVVGTLASLTSPETVSIANRSVKVPPTSMPTVSVLFDAICSDREILFAKRCIGGELGHRAAEADLAFLDDIGAVGDRLAEAQVLFAQQHRQALLLERADRLRHLLHDDRRQPLRR